MKKYASMFILTMFIIGTDTFLISPLLTTLSSLYHIDTSISDGRDRKKVMVY